MLTVSAVLPLYPDRPRTRGECVDGVRPCPWASCRHNLAVDVTPGSPYDRNGFVRKRPLGLKIHHAYDEGDPMPVESCALDVAALGGLPLEDVGAIMGVTRERVRQIEVSALKKIRAAAEANDVRPIDFTTAEGLDWGPAIGSGELPTHAESMAAKVPGDRKIHFTRGFATERPSGVRLKTTKGE